MLRELHISNLAVIEDICIELSSGLNCFTGQTGAGKSLIIGAFELLLGLRSGGAAELIRAGAEEARISGVFELNDPKVAAEIAALADVTLEEGEPLLITRKLYASGRSSASLNGQPATAGMIRAIGELLVDVHGQHDHQYLLKPSNQLLVLDGFARTMDLREAFGERQRQLVELDQRREELSAAADLRTQQRDLYEFQAQEIDAAELVEGEFRELKARHALLNNLKQLKQDSGKAYAALYDSEGAIVERLQMLTHLMGEMVELDEELRDVSEQVRSATLSLQDAAFELARYVDRLDQDPGELVEIEDRLNTLNRLATKYGSTRGALGKRAATNSDAPSDPGAEVLAYRADIGQKLDKLRGEDDDLSQIDSRRAALVSELERIGDELSEKRKAAARRLRPLIEAQLKELGMAEALFEIAFVEGEVAREGDGIREGEAPAEPVSEAQESNRKAYPSGFDQIEMLVRTNPGQPARPLRKVASGGELSRIMLGLKSILAHSDRISVLVFDEIDANIGGRLGTVIGRKLRELAGGSDSPPSQGGAGGGSSKRISKSAPKNTKTNGSSDQPATSSPAKHQVLCITHLPQIAAFGNRHMRISKTVSGTGDARQTVTTVTHLEGKSRIEELAEMLAGKDATKTTRKQVEELLATAG
ncbi:MAG: DNA repair protein RecN [Phycisphaeraceae bacterium]